MSSDFNTTTTSNGINNPYNFSDTELISINNHRQHTTTASGSANYTSLKDILPQTPIQLSGISPTHNSSWHEIPIRNPLVKHAAWAYLQPMSTLPDSDDNRCCFFTKLNSLRCGEIGCFEYFRNSILRLFLNRRDSDVDEDDGFCGGGGCKVDWAKALTGRYFFYYCQNCI